MKLLITLDGSKFAEEVLAPAAELATRSGAEVHLIEVVKESSLHPTWTTAPYMEGAFRGDYDEYEWPRGVPMGSPEYPIEMGVLVETAAQAEERTCRVAKEYLDSVAGRFFHGEAKTKVMVGEDPAEEILDYIRREKMDLVAMATHGRTGLARLLLGSVAAKLLHARAAPLFLVRPHKLHDG
jgi:nucleotide-binding universal stress UspA family protein